MLITSETTKTCIECGETKGLNEFDFVGPARSRRLTRCCACLLSPRPTSPLADTIVGDTIGFVVVEETDVVPSTSFVGELEVVDACWSNCVEVGPPGIRRMFDRLDIAATDMEESPYARLIIRDLVREFRSGVVPLKQARRVIRTVLAELQAPEGSASQKS